MRHKIELDSNLRVNGTVCTFPTPMKFPSCSRTVIAITALAAVIPQAARAATIVDETFNIASNSSVSYIQPWDPGNYSYAEGEHDTVANSLIVRHVHDAERDVDDNFPVNTNMLELISLVRISNVTYTPTVSGVIETLSMSLDFRTTHPFSQAFVFIEDLSGGVLGGLTPINNPGDQTGEWVTLQVLGLTDADFLGEGRFSSSNPLKFGFGFVSSATLDPFGTDPEIFEIEVDNFQVSIQAIPEPGSALMLLAAAVLAFCRGRRSWQ